MIREKLSPVSLKGSLPVYFYAWHGGKVPELPETDNLIFELSELLRQDVMRRFAGVKSDSLREAVMVGRRGGISTFDQALRELYKPEQTIQLSGKQRKALERSVIPKSPSPRRVIGPLSPELFEKVKKFEESIVAPHLDLVDSNSRRFYGSMPYAKFIHRNH